MFQEEGSGKTAYLSGKNSIPASASKVSSKPIAESSTEAPKPVTEPAAKHDPLATPSPAPVTTCRDHHQEILNRTPQSRELTKGVTAQKVSKWVIGAKELLEDVVSGGEMEREVTSASAYNYTTSTS